MNVKTCCEIPEYGLAKKLYKKSQHKAFLIIDEKLLISSFDEKMLEN